MEESFLKEKTGFVSAREDMIGKLPDTLISQIFLYLPTKEAVRTCVLSNRWKSLWLLIPKLDLDSSNFPDYNSFVSFMNRFLDTSREDKPCLHKLKLSIYKCAFNLSIRKFEITQSCFTPWIDFVATSKLKHLDVQCRPIQREYLEVMPLSLYICVTLVYLRLHRVLLGNFESVSLPRLKTMRLEHNIYASEACLESLISSCLALEDLSIIRRVDDNVTVLRVRSQTITSCSIKIFKHDDDIEDLVEDLEFEDSGFFIDAPRLKYLAFIDDTSGSKFLSNSGSLAKVNIGGYFHLKDSVDEVDLQKRYMVLNFFTRISGVKDMRISSSSFLLINDMTPLPQFCNLTCLEVELYHCFVEKLPMFLESCPNLKSLRLELLLSIVREKISLFVPQCLLSSLEFIEIKGIFRGCPTEMLVARYFAENSVILKKLVLRLRGSMKEKYSDVLRALLALPTRSSKCQIEVCEPLKDLT